MSTLKVRMRLLPHAADLPAPNHRHEHDLLDLVAAVPANAPVIIAPGGRAAISTGLVVELPPGTQGQIRSRSGLALHRGVIVLDATQTITADYRGEIHVILINLGHEPFTVERGALIAYLIVAPALTVEWEWPLPADFKGERS